jgi:subtilisin family serine protease
MRRSASTVLGVVLCALAAAPSGLAARHGEPLVLRPSITFSDAVALRNYAATLIQLPRERAARGAAILRRHGGELVSRRLGIWSVQSRDAQVLLPALARIHQLRTFEPNYPLRRQVHTAAVAEPLLSAEWWLSAIGADRAEAPGAGVPVTVIDTGLDMTHPEFAQRPNTVLLNQQDIRPVRPEYHGTAVSSVVGAPLNGVGVVGLYPNAVLREFDAGDLSVANEIRGIEAAIDAGPGIISISLGSDQRSTMEEQEVLRAFGAGSVVVAAAGNEFEQGNPVEYPASYNHVLTVAATDQQNKSSYFSNASLAVDLAAPGEGIPVAVPTWYRTSGYTTLDGTSFSTPMVAAAAAWVWTRRPDLDRTQLFDLMRWSATDIGPDGFDKDTGFGLLDIPAALTEAAPATDHQEPNDDIFQVKPHGLFDKGDDPITRSGKPSGALSARLDTTEDPEDVYRAWIPAHKGLRIRVVPNRNVALEVWDDATTTVYLRGAARRRHLIASSDKAGNRPEQVLLTNPGRGQFVYVDIFLPENGPLDASYKLNVATTRR